ncbi:hypothetical protein M1329_00910 [Candidatus Marsarchaeota archaeon]|nr:hypothetical protein [Candidatus Marsarchaeota archaeon]MCL5099924.1 hypothetical protein [Candidatus Marsarchaeota archaeon]
MKYAREHVKRYWIFAYRRALGVSMVTFAIALAIGIMFTGLLSPSFTSHPMIEFAFWGLLIIVAALMLIMSFANAHRSSVRLMNELESRKHSKYMAAWVLAILVGIAVFVMPVVFINSFIAPLMFLLSFGGILWVLYISVTLLFRHSYKELAYGATALLVVFVVVLGAITATMSNAALYASEQGNMAAMLFITVATLVLVFGFTGMLMMFNSSKEFVTEFENAVRELEGRPQRRTGRRARRGS